MTPNDLNIGLTDSSAKEFAEELISELTTLNQNIDTHAMTNHTNYLRGRKDMLSEIIEYISLAKPS